MAPVTDPADIRILIPRVRRMIDGPEADSATAVGSSLSDTQITGLIADAISNIILSTNGTWGIRLIPGPPGGDYLEPTSWTTAPALDPAAQSVVAISAAVGHLYRVLANRKISEDMRDEGSSWAYTVSASVLRDWLKALQTQLDQALAQLAANGVALDTYSSFITVRDPEVAPYAEPWVGL